MKKLISVLALLFVATSIFAQLSKEDLFEGGVKKHRLIGYINTVEEFVLGDYHNEAHPYYAFFSARCAEKHSEIIENMESEMAAFKTYFETVHPPKPKNILESAILWTEGGLYEAVLREDPANFKAYYALRQMLLDNKEDIEENLKKGMKVNGKQYISLQDFIKNRPPSLSKEDAGEQIKNLLN
ncbi:hypothetical protein AAIR98_000834 [Elusimicrobium simillimum]|uniref:hypothetical protein n=1 Tax=Elusimicrobium simillimum TaxID=3143438 RepID=UPI003C6F11B0